MDFPGHGSQRFKLEGFLPSARAVVSHVCPTLMRCKLMLTQHTNCRISRVTQVFVVDSVDTDLQATAGQIYSLLTNAAIAGRRVPMLIACNKQGEDS